MRRFPVVLASSLALVVALTGCSDSSTSSKASNTSATTTTGAAATTAPAASGSAATTTGPALPAGTELPTATGSFGDKPTLTFPKTTGAPTTVKTKVLHQGTGPVVAKNDLLVAAYLGQIWNGKVFDNSYDRKAPTGFTIGAGKVIPGWDSTLVGQKVGTRLLISIPPAQGYGSAGQAQAGISGTDTLVFVVDIIGTYNKTVSADAKGTTTPLPANTGVSVTGALTGAPTVKILKGGKAPTKQSITVISKGTGKPVVAGTVVVQYVAASWAGQTIDSTWATGSPAAFPVGSTSGPSVFDKLIGVPVGSRVLLLIPSQTGQTSASASPTTQPAVAVAVDIVAQYPNAA